jgi:hypothetical protein
MEPGLLINVHHPDKYPHHLEWQGVHSCDRCCIP